MIKIRVKINTTFSKLWQKFATVKNELYNLRQKVFIFLCEFLSNMVLWLKGGLSGKYKTKFFKEECFLYKSVYKINVGWFFLSSLLILWNSKKLNKTDLLYLITVCQTNNTIKRTIILPCTILAGKMTFHTINHSSVLVSILPTFG